MGGNLSCGKHAAIFTLIQSRWNGCHTGNREKLSNRQVCWLAQLYSSLFVKKIDGILKVLKEKVSCVHFQMCEREYEPLNHEHASRQLCKEWEICPSVTITPQKILQPTEICWRPYIQNDVTVSFFYNFNNLELCMLNTVCTIPSVGRFC